MHFRLGGRELARRWQASVYLVTEPVAPGEDRITSVPAFMLRVSRSAQYRLIWDQARAAWRIDKRSADSLAGEDDEAALADDD